MTDDHLVVRDGREWTSDKLWYVERYIQQFVSAMKGKRWRALNYIDLFAGPGKVRINSKVELGSPLIAMRYGFHYYFFNDISEANISALRERTKAGKCHYWVGDANEVVSEVVEEIQTMDAQFIPDTWSTLNLAFLDPEGLELKWKTIEVLARVNRMDMIIYYSQMGINRVVPKAVKDENGKLLTRLNKFFGTDAWRDVYEDNMSGSAWQGKLLELYKERLEALDTGYKGQEARKYVVDDPLIRNTRRHAPLYRLLFVSKHPLGRKLWDNAIARNAQGQERLL